MDDFGALNPSSRNLFKTTVPNDANALTAARIMSHEHFQKNEQPYGLAFKGYLLRVEKILVPPPWSWPKAVGIVGPVNAFRVRVPELHAMHPEPNILGGDDPVINLYPLYYPKDKDEGDYPLGSIVYVDYEDRTTLTGPIFLGPVDNLKKYKGINGTMAKEQFESGTSVDNALSTAIDGEFYVIAQSKLGEEKQKYIYTIDKQFRAVQEQLNKEWPISRVKEEAMKVAKNLKIEDPGAFWTLIMTEASGRPVGVYGNYWEKAVKANSSAYGIGQNTRWSNWADQQRRFPETAGKIDHSELYKPENGIFASGLYWKSYCEGMGKSQSKKTGKPVLLEQFRAYTGQYDTAQKKFNLYATYKREVATA